jgi:hypothetical protein
MTKKDNATSQRARFFKAARELGADEDEASFDKRVAWWLDSAGPATEG